MAPLFSLTVFTANALAEKLNVSRCENLIASFILPSDTALEILA